MVDEIGYFIDNPIFALFAGSDYNLNSLLADLFEDFDLACCKKLCRIRPFWGIALAPLDHLKNLLCNIAHLCLTSLALRHKQFPRSLLERVDFEEAVS